MNQNTKLNFGQSWVVIRRTIFRFSKKRLFVLAGASVQWLLKLLMRFSTSFVVDMLYEYEHYVAYLRAFAQWPHYTRDPGITSGELVFIIFLPAFKTLLSARLIWDTSFGNNVQLKKLFSTSITGLISSSLLERTFAVIRD